MVPDEFESDLGGFETLWDFKSYEFDFGQYSMFRAPDETSDRSIRFGMSILG